MSTRKCFPIASLTKNNLRESFVTFIGRKDIGSKKPIEQVGTHEDLPIYPQDNIFSQRAVINQVKKMERGIKLLLWPYQQEKKNQFG